MLFTDKNYKHIITTTFLMYSKCFYTSYVLGQETEMTGAGGTKSQYRVSLKMSLFFPCSLLEETLCRFRSYNSHASINRVVVMCQVVKSISASYLFVFCFKEHEKSI